MSPLGKSTVATAVQNKLLRWRVSQPPLQQNTIFPFSSNVFSLIIAAEKKK